MTSINIARYRKDSSFPFLNITFDGLQSNGNSISQTFSYSGGDSGLASKTYFFNNFNDLLSLSFFQDRRTLGHMIQVDNIVVSTSPVPEPSMAILFGVGLMTLVSLRRKYFA